MFKRRFLLILAVVLGCVLSVHGVVYPQVLESVSIRVTARVSTHPTSYSTTGSGTGVTVPLAMTSPVVCDLDCDDVLEVVAGGYDGTGTSYVYIWNRSGSVKDGWPVSLSGQINGAPSVGDLDGDGNLEIVVSVGESVYAYNDDGTLVSGYPVSYGYTLGAPVVGDCTGDFGEEVVARQDGSSVALSDVDLDGKKEIIVTSISGISVTEYDGTVLYSWDVTADSISNVALGDVDSDGVSEIFLGVEDGSVNYIHGWEIDGSVLTGFPIDTGDVRVGGTDSLALADLDSDDVPEIITGSVNGWVCAYNTSGEEVFRREAVSGEDGLLLRYDFDDGTADDLSGNGNDGTISGAGFVGGISGSALSFDGASSVSCSGVNINPEDAITVEAWVNPSNISSTTRQIIIGKSMSWGLFIENGWVFFYTDTRDDGGSWIGAAWVVPDNGWSHLAGTYDSSSGIMNFYINGNLITTREQTGSINNRPDTALYAGRDYAGAIDEVRVYDRALSEDEIGSYLEEVQSGALLYCDFTDGNAVDESAHGNNGTVYGAALADGYYGDGLDFNGTGYVICPGGNINPSGAITVEAWVNPGNISSTTRQTIIGKTMGWGLFLQNGWIFFYTDTRDDGGTWMSAAWVVPQDTWSHIAGTYDGSIMNFYINGNLVTTREQTGSVNVNSAPLYVGLNYEGAIDEVKVYDTALSEEEIETDMAGGEEEGNSGSDNIIYQPVVADVDNDGEVEILAGSSAGYIYCWNSNGDLEDGWPVNPGYNLDGGLVLCDIEQDSTGNGIDPAGDLELIYSCADNGRVYVMELNGDFAAEGIQWVMHRFDNRGTANWEDNVTSGWSVFDNEPAEAEIRTVYDWNRGKKVVELDGAGLNNGYAFLDADGSYLNTKNTQLQWSMRYSLDFVVYVSVDTTNGRRYLYYTPTEGDSLADGQYIHHGLGEVKDGKWHTFSRSLVQDLHDAEPDNEIVDINAFYIQGSGRIDDLMFISGDACGELTNYALDATVSVSSGDATKDNINDGDPESLWMSDSESSPWVNYSWDEPLEEINKITIENVTGASGVTIFINGHEYEYVEIDSDTMEIVFDSVEDVSSIRIVFDIDGSYVSVGEIGVYYDPNYEEDELPEEEYTTDTYIQIRDGYFWDPTLNGGEGGYWLPHGIAYQTWNSALGQWQSPTELRNDLDMMVSAGANALRVDFVWKHIEEEDDVFSWDNYDMLLEEAQARGIKVFPVIGYQWPPDWWEEEHPEWYTMHPRNEAHPEGPWLSDILSYENEDVRAEFSEFLQAVSSRYSIGGAREDLADTVAGWILGNEYGYLGLWSVEYDGYDDACQSAFHEWLAGKYSDISELNARWANDNVATPGYLPGHPYSSFDDVDMPIPFGYTGETQGQYLARDKASWYDLTEWREESIAGFVALAAQAVRDVDSAHLITYAAVGMQWGEEDWRYHTEDATKISQACSNAGVPLGFWSINNYPWGRENDELMTGKWGIERARHDTDLPVMVTETGFTSTETIYPGMNENEAETEEERELIRQRQADLVRNAIWEALESGAMGVCVFHWNDRDQIGLTERERGFGIVDVDKNPKPAYYAVQDAFQRMDEIGINELLPQFVEPAKDIAFLWDDAIDSIVNRYEAEMHQLYGALKRLGFNPTFINRDEMSSGEYLNYRAIVLPRNQKMFSDVLELLDDAAISGVKLHVDCDLPGIMDEYGNARNTDTDWLLLMQNLFGIDTSLSNLNIDTNLEDSDYSYGYYETSSFTINYEPKLLYSSILGYNATIGMWKYRDEVVAGSGTVLARFDGDTGNPSLIVNDYTGDTTYDTAISLFSLGDSAPDTWTWEDRYNWMELIYIDSDYGFGLTPDLTISGSPLVLVDYRTTSDESKVLLSFKNYNPDTSETVYVTSGMLLGKVVEDLINDEVIENPCDGTISQTPEADGLRLLLAYNEEDDTDDVEGLDTDEGGDSGGGTDSSGTSDTSSGSSSSSDSSTDSSSTSYSTSSASSDSTSSSDTSSGSSSSSSDSSSSSSGTKGTSSTTDEEATDEDTESSSTNYAGGTVVVLGSGGTSGSSGSKGGSDTTGSAQGSSAEESSHFRSYIGNGEETSGKVERFESNLKGEVPPEELPPMEQFAQAINTAEREMPGIIKVMPKEVTREQIEEILHPKPKPQQTPGQEIPTWVKKAIEFITNLVKHLNSQNLRNLINSRLNGK